MKHNLEYETPAEAEILEAYINKNVFYKKSDARRIRRELRKLRLRPRYN